MDKNDILLKIKDLNETLDKASNLEELFTQSELTKCLVNLGLITYNEYIKSNLNN